MEDARPLYPWEPVSYFEIEQECVTINLEKPQKAKYIKMMTLSAKGFDDNIFDLNPLAFNYFIVKGSVIKEENISLNKILKSKAQP